MRPRKRYGWGVVAIVTLAFMALGTPALAALNGSWWDLQLKMTGSASKIAATKGTLPGRLSFEDSTFTLSSGLSGTYLETETKGRATLSLDAATLEAFIRSQLEAAGAAKGVTVTSLVIRKVASVVTTKRLWKSLDCTFTLNVTYVASALVGGKEVKAAKGSLRLSAKAANPQLGNWALVAGSVWSLNGSDTTKADGTRPNVDTVTITHYFGPNSSMKLLEGEFLQIDDDGYQYHGSYEVDRARERVVFHFSLEELTFVMMDIALNELPPWYSDIEILVHEASSFGSVQDNTMQFDLKFTGTMSYDYWDQPFTDRFTAARKTKGIRVGPEIALGTRSSSSVESSGLQPSERTVQRNKDGGADPSEVLQDEESTSGSAEDLNPPDQRSWRGWSLRPTR